MADQIPKIKSKRQVLQLKPPHLCFQMLTVGLLVLAASICSIQTATCPSLVPSIAAKITEQCTFDLNLDDLYSDFIPNSILRSFSGYAYTQTSGIVVGSISNSLYYMYRIQPKKRFLSYKIHIQLTQN